MADEQGWLRTSLDEGAWTLAAGGRWTLSGARGLSAALDAVAVPRRDGAPIAGGVLDVSAIDTLDTTGAWLLMRAKGRLEEAGLAIELRGVRDAHRAILDRVARAGPTIMEARARILPRGPLRHLAIAAFLFVHRMGQATVEFFLKGRELIEFFGRTLVVFARLAVKPWRLRGTSLFAHMETTGLNALPIVGLLSFLIGVVIAFQGADILRQFGAEVFTVNLLGVSILRELGILITAIVIAGRSGSAFTAQIGTMKVNEEVDAMLTLGLDPMEILVIPRILALIVTLPLLTVYADIIGLTGGAVMAWLVLDISFSQFVNQLGAAVTLDTFLVGVVKAPVFAYLIAMVGCFEGLQVRGSAASVGRLTTMAVVESIFLVIAFDALFSVLFSEMGI